MKFLKMGTAALIAMVTLAGCNPDQDTEPTNYYGVDFNTGLDGWTGGYTDYTTGLDSTTFEFQLAQAALPAPLDSTKKGYRISGQNRSDDLFMYIKRKVSGLNPNTSYDALFSVDFASMYADSSVGAGGSPATSVYLKAGASATEPVKVKDGDTYEFSLDKGNQSQGGKDAVLLGNLANGSSQMKYKTVNRTSTLPLRVKTDASGNLWLFVGTDSGFEGLNALYYQRVQVQLTPVAVN